MTRSAVAATCAGAVAGSLVPLSARRAPHRLVRVNVRGARVPAVLGAPLAAGALAGLGAAAAGAPRRDRSLAAACAAAVAITGAGGLVDDLRGDEAARGFRGHLSALAAGRVTGGIVKIAAGAAAGALCGVALAGRARPWEATALVALSANFVNLLDRAPGRAAKVAIAAGAPLLAWGAPEWRPSGAALLGAVGACLPADLGERAMLGDAGANPIGAVLGLGLAASLGPRSRIVALAALAGATAASERLSFSRAIERVSWLRAADQWGRRAL